MICVIGLSLFGLEILKIFTSSTAYWEAYLIIPVISFSILFGMMKDTSLIGLQIMKKTWIIGSVILFIIVLNLGLNILLIPYLDIYGAAIATLVSQAFYFLIIIRYAQKLYNIPYEFHKIWWMILVGIILTSMGLGLAQVVWYIRIPVKFILLVSFPFILYAIRFYEPVEIESIKAVFKKWNKPSEWGENLRDLLKP
jgi:O-antigen/teichoic acid export membrane protein